MVQHPVGKKMIEWLWSMTSPAKIVLFEVVFLNVRFQGPGLTATTLLKKGTRVLVPRAKTSEEVRADGVALLQRAPRRALGRAV